MPADVRNHSHRVDEYLNFLAVERGASLNTLEAYSRDIHQFLEFAEAAGAPSVLEVNANMPRISWESFAGRAFHRHR